MTTEYLSADTSSSHLGHFIGQHGLDEVSITITKPKAFDNLDGEIHTINYELTPSNRLKNPSNNIGTLTSSDDSAILLFKLNGAYLESGQDYQECEINWSCVDFAGNSNENNAVTNIKIHDITNPYIDTSGIIYAYANSQSVLEGQRKTQISIALPRISDNVSNGLGDGSGGTIRLDYRIFNYNWNSSFGWDPSGNMYAGADVDSGENITSDFNVNFTLSAANIHNIREANLAEDDSSDSKYENFYIYWKATDNANNSYLTEQLVQITDDTAPILSVTDVSGYAASDGSTTIEIILPVLTDNLSTEFGLQSEGKIKLDYRIFDHSWIEEDGWDETNKYANVNLQEDTDISGAFYVDFTLSGENIFAITSNYENFYIYWKATDSANNISYKKQEVKIIDNTAPGLTVYDVSGIASSNSNTSTQNIVLPTIETNNNSINEFGPISEGKIKLDYKIFNHNWIEEHGWDPSGNMYANVNLQEDIDITAPFDVDFTLSGANIHTIREANVAEDESSDSKYENFLYLLESN